MKKLYSHLEKWKEIQQHLPEANRIDELSAPQEEYWPWKGNHIHLDRYSNPDAAAKLILLHGVGGNGRLLSFIGVPLYRHGFEIVCPDLPGYGISSITSDPVDYSLWVDMVRDLIETEASKDSRPIVLFGLSAGGMLAYHAGCNNRHVKGMIFTNLLDQRLQEVRDYSATSKFMSRVGIYTLVALRRLNNRVRLPMKMVANMKAIVNDKGILRALLSDKTSSGASVTVELIMSMIEYNPRVEPADFALCPLLLVHPERDLWTDVRLSKLTFDKFPGDRTIRMLEEAGHFPLEQPGLSQLEHYIVEFIREKVGLRSE